MRAPAVIFDFHGTLANTEEIKHHLIARDYEGFYTNSLSCPPIEATVEAAKRSHALGYVNLLFTAMPVEYEVGLGAWLLKNDVPVTRVDMRKKGDRRKDFVVKNEMYLNAVAQGYDVMRAWEDSPRVVDLWNSLGIPVEVIPGYVEI